MFIGNGKIESLNTGDVIQQAGARCWVCCAPVI